MKRVQKHSFFTYFLLRKESKHLLSLRKKVGKEPFGKRLVLLLITCRNPRGKFFAKLSAKESGKKVGKEPFDNGFVLLLIICRNPRCKFFAKLSAKESGEAHKIIPLYLLTFLFVCCKIELIINIYKLLGENV